MILILIGFISGIVSGMGIGGGAILIPALVLAVNPLQHTAQSVNLIFFIPTAMVALLVHAKNKRIDIKAAVPTIIFGLIGAYAGGILAAKLQGAQLRKLFGIFLMAMGIYELLSKKTKKFDS